MLELWPHQQAAVEFVMPLPATLLDMGMGTGKTAVAITLLRRWRSRRALVLCPQAVIGVWRRELEIWWPKEPIVWCAKPGQSVARRVAEASRAWARNREFVLLIANYEMLVNNKFFDFCMRPGGPTGIPYRWDSIILDESHRAKGPRSKVSIRCGMLGGVAERRICLSGTPMAHKPLDIWGQYRFLDASVFGGWRSDWWAFRAQYSHIRQMPGVPMGIEVSYRNVDGIVRRIAPTCYRVSSDVLSLPDATDTVLDVELTSRAKKVYDRLESAFIAQLEEGTIVAGNALVHLLRLQQVASGFGVTELGKYLDLGDHKLRAIKEVIADIPQRDSIVVFCRFRYELSAVRELADQLGRIYAEVSGSRKDLTDKAKMLDHDGQILGVQISAGSEGVDFTGAHYAFYLSHGLSLKDYVQSRARLVRPGQEHSVSFYHVLANRTVDWKVYRGLKARRQLIESVLTEFEKEGQRHVG